MARKKQEIALQVVIETQEEWEEMLAKEGLTVVDVFQEWAGPCTGMVSSFRRLKNELGDDSLHFAVAKSDTIDSLEKYRGKCEPCFLFFAGGVLVAQMRGANAPQLLRMITEQLAYEHKVLEGNAERKEIKDPMLVGAESAREEEEEEEEEGMEHMGERIIFENLPEYADNQEEQKKGVTLAIIKPNVVADGKVDEILEKIREAGIEILEHKEKTLTEEEAREFYAHKKDEEYFEDLIKFMTSGPSHVLVITKGQTGEGIVEEWRELLGPASVDEARQVKPDSLRAKYGGDKSYVNALHGSDSHETAMRELAFFFPDFVVPTVPGGKAKRKLQRTLALIRPDALREKKDEILAKIKEAGFTVAMQKEVQLSREQAEEFYKEHRDEPYFEELVNRMTNGPLLALALAREDAVTGWKEMLGPKEVQEAKEKAPESLRAQFSLEDVPVNQIHGSESEELAQKEISYFFPMEQTVAVIKPDAYESKDEIMNKIREAGFHIAARKETELTREIAEQFYKDQKDKEYFSDLTDHMSSGPTLFMVLSREDAVQGWRSVMGPVDPEKAKEEDPETLRAQFGSDIKANAIHGSSSALHAEESMKLIFGDLKFNPDGTVVKPEKEARASKKLKEADSEEREKEAEAQEATKEAESEEEAKAEDKKSAKEEAKQESEEAKEGKKEEQDAGQGKAEAEQKVEKGDNEGDEVKNGASDDKEETDQKHADGDGKVDNEKAGDDDLKGDRPKSATGEAKKTDVEKEDDKRDDKKEDDKNDEDRKDEDKKADDKKEDDKKEEDKKDEDKKEDGKKEEDKKEEDKKDEDKKEDGKTEEDKKDEDKKDEDKKEDGKTEEDKKDEDKKDEDKKDEDKKDEDKKDEDKKEDGEKPSQSGQDDENKGNDEKKGDEQKPGSAEE